MKRSLMFITLSVWLIGVGATEVVLPTEPVFTNVSVVSPNAAAALTNPSTNSVFIDQSGSNPNVSVLQDGTGNKMGTAVDPIYLRGADQNIQASQVGANNILDLRISNPPTGQNVGANVQVRQIGNSNDADISCGVGTASDGTTALTGCRVADINYKAVGNNNTFQFRGGGQSQSSQWDIAGNGNNALVDAIGDGHSQTVKIVGDNNTLNITQTSTGAGGSSVWVDHWGSGSSFTISQTGTTNNVLNLRSVSTNGTFSITQRN